VGEVKLPVLDSIPEGVRVLRVYDGDVCVLECQHTEREKLGKSVGMGCVFCKYTTRRGEWPFMKVFAVVPEEARAGTVA
jgi:hypothetical protein